MQTKGIHQTKEKYKVHTKYIEHNNDSKYKMKSRQAGYIIYTHKVTHKVTTISINKQPFQP